MYEVHIGDVEHLYAYEPEGGDVSIEEEIELDRTLDILKNRGTLGSEDPRHSTIKKASEELGIPVSTQITPDDLISIAKTGKSRETPEESSLVDKAIGSMEDRLKKEFYERFIGLKSHPVE